MRESPPGIEVAPAGAADLPAIVALLTEAELPASDVADSGAEFLVARRGPRVVGAIGLESLGSRGLLRSLVVAPAERGRGIADLLVEHLLALAGLRGLRRLDLITTTAAGYFARRGFAPFDRAQAPEALRAHPQFRSLCPSTATCLSRELPFPGLHG